MLPKNSMVSFKKGYADDVGIDICLDQEVIFRPFETKIIDIGPIETEPGISLMMCARSSAAAKGIIVNQCPIDPNYKGHVHIIAHNCSNYVQIFKKGKAFAQLYAFRFETPLVDFTVKKPGTRTESSFGGTDNAGTD